MSRLFESTLTGKISRMLVEGEEVKPIKKTREELIRDHGTDNVDLINAGKEPEKRVVLKGSDSKLKESKNFIDNIGKIADFIIEYDPYEFRNSYDGDDEERKGQLVRDIARDKDAAKAYITDISNEDEDGAVREKAKEVLKFFECDKTLKEDIEEPTPEDLEKDEELSKAKSKEEIENRIGELRAAIADGVSDDEKEAMEKEIASLENELTESSIASDMYVTENSNGSYIIAQKDNSGEEYYFDRLLFGDKISVTKDKDFADSWKNKSDAESFMKDIIEHGDDLISKVSNTSSIKETDTRVNECDKSLNEDITVITPENEKEARKYLSSLYKSKSDYESDSQYHNGYTKYEYQFQKSEIKRIEKLLKDYEKGLKSESTFSEGAKIEKLTEDSYEKGIFKNIEAALVVAGFEVHRYIDTGVLTKNIGWEVSYNGNHTQLECPGSWYDEDDDDTLEESVEVATNDGSTVSTQDAASVSSNDGQVTVQTADTVVVISNSAMPTEDVPVEEPTEVPGEEVTEPAEEVPEDIEDDENGSDNLDEADESSIDANVEAKSLDVVKNQGITYMLHIVETSGKETYWVCDNFNAETNEGDNAKFFDTKEEADKEYFSRVGLEPVEK